MLFGGCVPKQAFCAVASAAVSPSTFLQLAPHAMAPGGTAQETPRLLWLTSFQCSGRFEDSTSDQAGVLSVELGQPASKRRRLRTLSDAELQDQLRRAGCTFSVSAACPGASSTSRFLEGIALVLPGGLWDGHLTQWTDGARLQRQYFANARDAFTVRVSALWRLQTPHEIKHVISQSRSPCGVVYESPIQFRPSHMLFRPSSLDVIAVDALTVAQTPGRPMISLEEACAMCQIKLHHDAEGDRLLLPVRLVFL